MSVRLGWPGLRLRSAILCVEWTLTILYSDEVHHRFFMHVSTSYEFERHGDLSGSITLPAHIDQTLGEGQFEHGAVILDLLRVQGFARKSKAVR